MKEGNNRLLLTFEKVKSVKKVDKTVEVVPTISVQVVPGVSVEVVPLYSSI
jgi:hypothetical protein